MSRVCRVRSGTGGHGDGDEPPPFLLPSDCPQVQCVHPYVAQQPDELTLELADILNILEKTEDGEAWYPHASHARTPSPPHWCPTLCTSPREEGIV